MHPQSDASSTTKKDFVLAIAFAAYRVYPGSLEFSVWMILLATGFLLRNWDE